VLCSLSGIITGLLLAAFMRVFLPSNGQDQPHPIQDVQEGDVAPADMAYLKDRLLIMEGKPQIYGTQFHIIDGVPEPFPIVDPDHVDEHRAQIGLEPFAEYEAQIRAKYSA
jgi:hypothetical protein